MVYNRKLNDDLFKKVKTKEIIAIVVPAIDKYPLKVGDVIEFLNQANKMDKIRARIIDVKQYKTFDEMPLSDFGYSKLLIDKLEVEHKQTQLSNNDLLCIEIELLMWKSKELTQISKYISLILRHNPDVIGIKLDEHGWANVEELIKGVQNKFSLNMDVLENIVLLDEKNRYVFSDDKTMIRANQGHSIKVDVELEELKPPEVLWHGTGERFVEQILVDGIKKQRRLYVHLSSDIKTAIAVGSRHGKVKIFEVSTKQMYKDGYKFYKSANGIWQTEYIPVKYIKLLQGK